MVKILKLDIAHTYIHASISDSLNTRAYMYIRLFKKEEQMETNLSGKGSGVKMIPPIL